MSAHNTIPLLCCFLLCISASRIVFNNGTFESSPWKFSKVSNFTISGILINISVDNCEVQVNSSALRGPSIGFIGLESAKGCDTHKLAAGAEALGLIGVIIHSGEVYCLPCGYPPSKAEYKNIGIPFVYIGIGDGFMLADMLSTLPFPLVVVLWPGPNPFVDILNSWYWFIVVILLLALITTNLGLSLWKIIVLRKGGKMYSVPLTVLSIEVCANAIRLLEWIDPLSWHSFYILMGSQLLDAIPLALTLITVLFLAFYWKDLTQQAQVATLTKLNKFIIPFILVGVFVLASKIATAISRGLNLQGTVPNMIASIVAGTLAVGIGIFYLISGAQVVQRILKVTDRTGHDKKRRLMLKISALVIAVGTLVILYAVFEFTMLGVGFARKFTQSNFIAIFTTRSTLSALVSLSLILSINVQKGVLSRKTSQLSSSKDSSLREARDIALEDVDKNSASVTEPSGPISEVSASV